jgi:hypothetical protein
MRRALAIAAMLSLGATAAQAQESVTVKSLLAQDFAVVGTMPGASGGGAGVFLQKKDKLFFCLVAETPTSPAVTTRYCKPVE